MIDVEKIKIIGFLDNLRQQIKDAPEYIDYKTRWRIFAAIDPIIKEVKYGK